MGCLGTFDFVKGEYVGMLAERWEVKDPNNWIFYLRKNAKFHDGSPLTAADVVHSFNRMKNDHNSKQTQYAAPIASVTAINNYTVKFTTHKPTAPLLEYLFDRFAVTSKAIYDKYGPEVADRKYPIGAGPYKLKELIPGERLVIGKNQDYPGMKEKKQAPDEVVFRIMREPEQRVTALLNGEIQIAQFIPPHLRDRVEKNSNTKLSVTNSVEPMFLAMSPKAKPWDNKSLRQAVSYAIDRDTIIATILQGQATRLDGPIGTGQYGFNPNLKPKYEYDPAKAKKLVVEAGYPDGIDVELYTPVGRYALDKQIAEAMVPMLNAVGIRAKLGRGSVVDPSVYLAEQFETGGSPRIGYSNPKLDALLSQARATFDPAKRKKVLSEAMSLITEEAPAHFLWRHQFLYGIAKNVEFRPRPNGRIFAEDIRVLR